jgi:Na+-transporting methylmalonyl-CoA/oxaloacetate decarboxylase gamma subunit
MDWTNFNESLKLMAMGMAGIFAFIMIFYGLVMVLIKIFPDKSQNTNNN